MLLRPLGDLRTLGRRWALEAGHRVLQCVDQPDFESVQICEMLTLYWFSSGDSQRNTMFSGLDDDDAHSSGHVLTISRYSI